MEKAINILLIEDNPADATFAGIQLKKAFGNNHSLQTCEYFGKALQLIEMYAYHIVILDLCLPDSKGLETLKSFVKKCNAPVIVYSGISDELVMKEAKTAGAMAYLIKGQVTVEMLKQSILNSLQEYYSNA